MLSCKGFSLCSSKLSWPFKNNSVTLKLKKIILGFAKLALDLSMLLSMMFSFLWSLAHILSHLFPITEKFSFFFSKKFHFFTAYCYLVSSLCISILTEAEHLQIFKIYFHIPFLFFVFLLLETLNVLKKLVPVIFKMCKHTFPVFLLTLENSLKIYFSKQSFKIDN